MIYPPQVSDELLEAITNWLAAIGPCTLAQLASASQCTPDECRAVLTELKRIGCATPVWRETNQRPTFGYIQWDLA